MSISRITKRIQKLIAMAQNNPNEAEASVAMERAYKMLAAHNLTMSEISAEGDEPEYMQDKCTIAKGGPWARTISNGISQLYFCSFFYTRISGRSEHHTFVGQEHNVALAQQISMTVIDIIHKAGKKQSQGNTPFLNSFRNAACNRIYSRCMALIAQAKNGELSDCDDDAKLIGTGLVLASLYDEENQRIEAYKKSLSVNLVSVKSRARSTSTDGRRAGTIAGNQVGLRPEISGKSNARLGAK